MCIVHFTWNRSAAYITIVALNMYTLNGRSQRLTGFMSIPQNYFHIVLEKNGILHSRITSVADGSLENKHHAALPNS